MTIKDMLQPRSVRAPMITLTGEEGIGKTTLAATFPNPVFLRFEDGTEAVSTDIKFSQFPIIKEYDNFRNQMLALLKEDHEFKTVIIDTVSEANVMFIKDILAMDKSSTASMATCNGGYGAGYQMLTAKHSSLRSACNLVNQERNLAFIFIIHNQVEVLDPPDGESYTKYGLQLHKDSSPIYLNNVDMVAHMRLDSMVIKNSKGDKLGKASSDTDRILVCHKTAAQVSKNRYHITEPLAVQEGENPLLELIPFFNK